MTFKKLILVCSLLFACSTSFASDSEGIGGKSIEPLLCKIFKFTCVDSKSDSEGIGSKSDSEGIGGKSLQFEGEEDARSQEADEQDI